jgi:hypothetical protein
MKYFYTLVLIVLLASCTDKSTINENNQTENNDTQTEIQDTTEKTSQDIESELSKIEVSENDEVESNQNEVNENKVVKLDAKYTNPETDVDMTIEYSIDDEGKISTINVSATTYDLTGYNNAVQVVIGKTIEEAKDISIAGSSLSSAAFKNALK